MWSHNVVAHKSKVNLQIGTGSRKADIPDVTICGREACCWLLRLEKCAAFVKVLLKAVHAKELRDDHMPGPVKKPTHWSLGSGMTADCVSNH
eukprot:1433637-Amphidinium_carterae.1